MSEQEQDKVEETEIATKEQEAAGQAETVGIAEDTPPTTEAALVEEVEETPSLEEQFEQVRQEAARNLENWQRAVAELANFKRRQEEQAKLQRDRLKAEVLEG